jgi:hypothetical protein
MAFVTYQLTLNGAAQRLSNVYGGAANAAIPSPVTDIPYRTVTFQGLKANTNDIFVGNTSSVSSTVHGFRIDPTDTQAPIVLGSYDSGPLKLSDFWVLGTSTEVLVVSGVPF